MKIWVDDIRTPPDYAEGKNWETSLWYWCLTSEQAIDFLEKCKTTNTVPKVMSLDHDLGGDDTSRAIVLWCCENDFWPVEVVVHSANPVGIEWLEGMISRYHPDNAWKYRSTGTGGYVFSDCTEIPERYRK